LIVTGVLGGLEPAASQELLDVPAALTRLLATNFYAPPNLVRAILAHDADRKSRPRNEHAYVHVLQCARGPSCLPQPRRFAHGRAAGLHLPQPNRVFQHPEASFVAPEVDGQLVLLGVELEPVVREVIGRGKLLHGNAKVSEGRS